MINALRHQRLVHVSRTYHRLPVRLRDQRLTASKVSTHRELDPKRKQSQVINALRHQRLVHNQPTPKMGTITA